MLSILNTLSRSVFTTTHYYSWHNSYLKIRIPKLRIVVTCLSSQLCNWARDKFYRVTWSRNRFYWEILQAYVSKRGTHSWSLSTSHRDGTGTDPCWVCSGFIFQWRTLLFNGSLFLRGKGMSNKKSESSKL